MKGKFEIKPSKVQISMCSVSGPEHETFCSYNGLLKHAYRCTPHSYTWRYAMRTFIHTGRTKLAEQALEDKADYLIWLDDDMVWPADMFHRLIATSQAYDLDILSGYYTTRRKVPLPLIYCWHEDIQSFRPTLPRPDAQNMLFEVDATGMGCCLMRTSVFERIAKPWFELHDGWTEDTYFFRKCAKQGIKIHVDTSLACGHHGDWGWCFPYQTPLAKNVVGNCIFADVAIKEAELIEQQKEKEDGSQGEGSGQTGSQTAQETGVSNIRLE